MEQMTLNELTEKIIGCAITVHRKLGPGFLESVYQAGLAYELRKARIPFEKEKPLPVPYEDIIFRVGFRCDFLVDKRVIVDTKAINVIEHSKMLNYLKITNYKWD